tara:strand:+ start:7107 stop:8180 length:1074 start_codon:yes stop_codon:yes gene_type:complete
MEFKVKEVTAVEEKSVQEVEKQLLDKHEEDLSQENQEVEVPEAIDTPAELKEEDVLSYIGKRYNKEINSFDELMSERETQEELPEDVAAYFKYKKDTGRGIKDFVELQKDFDDVDPDSLLKDYLVATETGLDEEDIDTIMEDYSFDEDFDEESDIKKVKLKKKKAIAKAKDYFKEMQEKYKQPLESSGMPSSNAPDEGYEDYKQYIADAKTNEEDNKRRKEFYDSKTLEVYSPEFKGFEFNVGDDTITFSPNTLEELKKSALEPGSWATKYLDDSGLIKDSVGFHRSVAVAQNPEKFAKFFYEQGKSNATEDVMRKTKNINMSERRTPEVTSKGGTQFKSLSNESGKGLKIRSAKRK